jgi:hypothetical protein
MSERAAYILSSLSRSYIDVSTIVAWMGRMLHIILTLEDRVALVEEARHVLVLYRAFRYLASLTWFLMSCLVRGPILDRGAFPCWYLSIYYLVQNEAFGIANNIYLTISTQASKSSST